MADAPPISTANPKELGKHLRSVRRRKGLSLSEVARGAGLSRRELVAYERGKVEIPESDLWVLAGSCGVDVDELMPASEPAALEAGPSTIQDSISQLRSNQPDADLQRHLDTLYALRALPPGSPVQLQEAERLAMAATLGQDATTIETRLVATMHVSPDEARRLRQLIVPDAPRYTPLALEAAADEPEPAAPAFAGDEVFPVRAAEDDMPSGPVDVFEELAKLPDPVALPDSDDVADVLAPLPEPAVLAMAQHSPDQTFADWQAYRGALPDPSTPVVVEPASPSASAASALVDAGAAPPIDVVGRPGAPVPDLSATREAAAWEPTSAMPPAGWDTTWTTPDVGPPFDVTGIVEFVDDYVDDVAGIDIDERPDDPHAGVDAAIDAGANGWSAWTRSWSETEVTDVDENLAAADHTDLDHTDLDHTDLDAVTTLGPWVHEPDPAATSTGFYVDWGADDGASTTLGTETAIQPDVVEPELNEPELNEPETHEPETHEPETLDTFASSCFGSFDTGVTETDLDVETDVDATPVADDLLPISWRPLTETVLAAVAVELATAAAREATPADVTDAELEPDLGIGPALAVIAEPETIENFATAGPDWDLGNAVPLVEVRGQGSLVMRRADERWALADVRTTPSFVLEVDVDFRSGPGFGALFQASTDAEGRMSGYSFDVDPIHEGGSYLVRQWHADRELWNPIARVAAPDPSSMHGPLTVRVVVTGDSMAAYVNNELVLSVESLKQECADRNRDPADGDRVGIQAWSSSDLVIDELRVAER